MIVLGISAFYHDSAAALVCDGRLIGAAQEERFSRQKHDPRFPKSAVAYCLAEGGIGLDDVDFIAFYEKPFLKFERLIETYLTFAPRGWSSFRRAMPTWLREKLFQKRLLQQELAKLEPDANLAGKLRFTEHHQSHAASAFFPSPFQEAAILTLDGVGEWTTTAAARGSGSEIEMYKEIQFPHSLGLLYSAFTAYLGFRVNSGEYKVMGLAPYGEPRYRDLILRDLIDVKPDGSFRLNMDYFDYCTGLQMTNDAFAELFEGEPRSPEGKLERRHTDLAASVQAVTDEVVLRLTRSLASETGETNLCLAGGVALNCVTNGKVLRDGRFRQLWIQPAAGDAGGALGAALAVAHSYGESTRAGTNGDDGMGGAYLGPSFTQAEIERRLTDVGARFRTIPEPEVRAETAAALASGDVVGWFQGRMEFGPRALGARSILADPRPAGMRALVNTKVKLREGFRPFAPAVRREDAPDWFDLDVESPYMLLVADVAESHRLSPPAADVTAEELADPTACPSDIPAVTHVDYSARVQTVDRAVSPGFHALLSEFKRQTGCPLLLNTSFNIRSEPIVCSPEDAYRCFMGTGIDLLVIGESILRPEDQPAHLRQSYADQLEQD